MKLTDRQIATLALICNAAKRRETIYTSEVNEITAKCMMKMGLIKRLPVNEVDFEYLPTPHGHNVFKRIKKEMRENE